MKLKISIILTLLCVFALLIPANANELDELKKEVNKLWQELQMQQAMTEELMSEKMSTEDKSSFTINGFIEARYENMDIKKGGYSTNNQSGSLVSYKLWKNREVGQFSVRNLNMYFDFKYGQKLRAFSEIKFLEYPSGTTKILGDPTTTDDGNGSFISHGSIYIERAWVDYKFNDLFKMQFGKMLTPFGIWNVEHGAPILPSIRVPASISYGMVPNNFVGINLHGNTLLKNWEFEYNAFVSNGRGVWNVENNNNKGIGASVNFKVPTKFLNKLVFGGMYYTGKEILEQQQKYDVPYTDTTYISGNEYLSFYDTIKNSAKEYCYTFHLATGYKKLEINAEYVYNNIKYENYNGIDNLNNRLFYRPDNRSLVESASANFAALPAGLTAAMGTLGTFGNDSTLIQALTALTAAGVNDTAHPLYGVYYGVGALIQGFNGGAKTVADAKKTNTPEGVAAFINSYYGYAMPLVTLNPKRSGYYIMSRYLLTPKFYPYFTYEAADPGDNDPFPPVKVYIFGFNYKPMPVITFKIEHSWQKFKREPLVTGYTQSAIASTRVEDFNYLQMSVSYAF